MAMRFTIHDALRPIADWYGGGIEGNHSDLDIIIDVVSDLQKDRAELLIQTKRIKELEAEREKPPEDILVCKCGWWGSVENQDALGSECGCCPSCGNEALVWLSKLQRRIKELEEDVKSDN